MLPNKYQLASLLTHRFIYYSTLLLLAIPFRLLAQSVMPARPEGFTITLTEIHSGLEQDQAFSITPELGHLFSNDQEQYTRRCLEPWETLDEHKGTLSNCVLYLEGKTTLTTPKVMHNVAIVGVVNYDYAYPTYPKNSYPLKSDTFSLSNVAKNRSVFIPVEYDNQLGVAYGAPVLSLENKHAAKPLMTLSGRVFIKDLIFDVNSDHRHHFLSVPSSNNDVTLNNVYASSRNTESVPITNLVISSADIYHSEPGADNSANNSSQNQSADNSSSSSPSASSSRPGSSGGSGSSGNGGDENPHRISTYEKEPPPSNAEVTRTADNQIEGVNPVEQRPQQAPSPSTEPSPQQPNPETLSSIAEEPGQEMVTEETPVEPGVHSGGIDEPVDMDL